MGGNINADSSFSHTAARGDSQGVRRMKWRGEGW